MTPKEFVDKWNPIIKKETKEAQKRFEVLCKLINVDPKTLEPIK